MIITCKTCGQQIDSSVNFGKEVCIDCENDGFELSSGESENKNSAWDNLAPRQREKNHWS